MCPCCLVLNKRGACASRPHRLFIVLEGLARLLEGADLLAALPLDVALLHLLQERVGPAQPPQHRVRRVRRQEHWEADGGEDVEMIV